MSPGSRSGRIDALALETPSQALSRFEIEPAWWVHQAAYGCCLLLPVACFTSTSAATALHLMALALLLVECWLWRASARPLRLARLLDLERPLALYVLAFLISSALGTDAPYSLSYSTELRRILIAFVIANVLRSPREVMGVAATTFLGAGICSGLAFCERFVARTFKPRVFSSTPNDFAVLMMLAACLAIGYLIFLDLKPSRRAGLGAVALALLYGTVQPNCRSVILGLVGGVGFVSLLLDRRRGLVLAGLLLLAIPLLPREITIRFRKIADLESTPNAYRIRTADLAWQIYRDHPVFGIGRRNFTAVTDRYKSPDEDPRPNAHDNYINVLVEMGPLGLVALLWFQVSFFLGALRRYRSSPAGSLAAATQAGVLMAFVAFAIAGLAIFDWGYLLPVSLFWMIIGLSYSPAAQPQA